MRRMAVKLLVIAVLLGSVSCDRLAANPIRKVVNMLQAMQTRVEQEGEAEKKLFEKFMCYCKTSGGDLKASIAAADTKVPAVANRIEEGKAKQVQLKADIKQHQADRATAKQSMADATALRGKQAKKFADERASLVANIAALDAAIKALEKGMAGGAFLQTEAARIIKKLVVTQNMLDADRQDVLAFLSGQSGYAPQSGEITGILKEMKDSMEKDLTELEGAEQNSIASYKSMMKAKLAEVVALTDAMEKKLKRSGELAVELVQMENDLTDTQAALIQDKKFMADMDKNCASKQAEWDVTVQTRAEELTALAETIKVLNDDDALELFKKTLPGASANFMQVTSSSGTLRLQALKVIVDAKKRFPNTNFDFIALALHGKKIGFEKVIKMIDDMVALLKREQFDDDSKKEYCAHEFDSLDDSRKTLEHSIAGHAAAIDDAQESIATFEGEIQAKVKSIAQLDKSVAEATEQRKEEHAEAQEVLAANNAAKEVLKFAKNRLNKFYNPNLYKAPPKRELSEEDRIVVNMGGTLAPTAAPGGVAGTGIGLVQISRHEEAPPPPPATAGAYQKKSGESGGVIAMIDLLIKDLDKESTEVQTTEKESQADYEATMGDAAKKRAQDSASLTEKDAAKADANAELEASKEKHGLATKEHMATKQVISNLHAECDWLLQYFDPRKSARQGEIDSLNNAKAVLSGADFSLAQMNRSLRGQA